MKKNVLLTSLIIAATVFSGCGSKKPDKITVKEKTLHLEADEKYTIKAETKKGKNIIWSSNDEKIAVISPDGTVTAVGNGITTVTAVNESGGFAHVGVVVGTDDDYVDENGNQIQSFNEESDITGIVVGVKAGGKGDISLKKGDEHQLVAYTTPSGSKDKIVWQTGDSKVARVNEKGVLSAVGTGKAVITAYAPNGVKGELIVRVK